MANILPLDAQKKVWSMYRARFVIALSLVLIALAAIAALTLVPSYLALELAAPPLADTPISHTQSPPQDPTAIARSQALVRAVQPLLSASTSATKVILLALQEKPKGVRIEHITYISGAPGQVTLSGSAPRELISAYGNALKQSKVFSTVAVPVGSLVSTDGKFIFSLTGDF